MQVSSEAKANAGRSRPRIGVFIEWVADDYSDAMLREVTAAAEDSECDLVCFFGGLEAGDHPVPLRHHPLVYADARNIDAALVVSLGNSLSPGQVAEVLQRLDPLPLCSVAIRWEEHPSVEVDNSSGVLRSVRHLIRVHGRKRIACIRGPLTSAEADERFAAYRQALEEEGLPFDPELVEAGLYIRPDGAAAIRRLIEQRRVQFDAVVAANDGMALGALDELEQYGILVPDQVSVVGFDDIDQAQHARPPLTTVTQPIREHARQAFRVLLDQLSGNQVARRLEVPAELVLRRSCGCILNTPELRSEAPAPFVAKDGEPLDALMGRLLAPLAAHIAGVEREQQEALVSALADAVLTDDPRAALRAAEAALDRRRYQHDVLRTLVPLQRAHAAALTHIADPCVRDRVAALCQGLSALLAEVAARSQADARYRTERLFHDLTRTQESIALTRDLTELAESLARHLTTLRIPGCYLCSYEGTAVPAETARVVLAVHDGRALELPEGGLTFPAHQLLPAQLAPDASKLPLLLFPMLRQEREIPGYIVFERGVPEGFVYDALVEQLNTAYRRMRLLRQLLREAELRAEAERQRLEKEMQLAMSIQTGILPRSVKVRGLEIRALMLPASEVGGDYYDVIPHAEGCYIGIGDVAGHGLPTGLVMLMLQSAIGSLTRNTPRALPSQVLPAVNDVLVDNIRCRMLQDEHVTLTLLRYEYSGKIRFSGAHEDILVCRAASGRVEHIPTPGSWVGITSDYAETLEEGECALEPGDVLLLHTDGLTEARNSEGELFGLSRLSALLEQHRQLPVDEILNAVLRKVQRWMACQEDDITLLVARQL